MPIMVARQLDELSVLQMVLMRTGQELRAEVQEELEVVV